MTEFRACVMGTALLATGSFCAGHNLLMDNRQNQHSKAEIVLGAGCFWCSQAALDEVRGVVHTEVGYSNGSGPQPDYESVCTGLTGYAEVVRVVWDPTLVSLHDLLSVFFLVHDPTTLNRQGHDIGTQYRSAVYWVDGAHQAIVQAYLQKLRDTQAYGERPVVTELAPLRNYWPAESYHQRYFCRHPERAYCQAVIAPKVQHLHLAYRSLTRA